MCLVVCLSRGVCVATLPSEVAADRSVGFVWSWLFITLNSELCRPLKRTATLVALDRDHLANAENIIVSNEVHVGSSINQHLDAHAALRYT